VGRAARIRLPFLAAGLMTAVVFALATTVRLKPDPTYKTPDATVRLKPDPTYKTPDATFRDVLLSRQLMDEAGVHVGDVVTLAADAGGTRAATFRVAGTYEPVPDPRKFSAKRLEARLHLPDLIALTEDGRDPASSDQVSALNLSLVNKKDTDVVAAALARRVPGMTAASTSRPGGPDDPFAVLERFHEAIAIVTVTGSTAFLLALMVMRAEERREIIGILRLMGIPSRSILVEVLLEGLLIAVAGAIFGVLLAVAAQSLVNRFFQWRYDTTLVFVQVTTSIAWKAVAFAVPLGVVAGLAASWTLLRRSVVELVRR
jgi:hypothetical protein